jgi:glutamine amidotransferase
MKQRIVIVDYGTGNLHSVKRALASIGVAANVSSDAADVERADKLILPGVGHFGKAITKLRSLNLEGPLNEAVVGKGRPILGICLGMELMARRSEEGDAEGLGWFDAEMVRFDVERGGRYKVPHIGWNRAEARKVSPLMKGVEPDAEFYFVHSYHLRVANEGDTMSETRYNHVFPSAIERDNIFGVQYHPEKSHDAGGRLLKNFVEL